MYEYTICLLQRLLSVALTGIRNFQSYLSPTDLQTFAQCRYRDNDSVVLEVSNSGNDDTSLTLTRTLTRIYNSIDRM